MQANTVCSEEQFVETVPAVVRSVKSRLGEFGVLAQSRFVEGEDYAVARDAGVGKFASDSVLRAVALNPELSVDEVDVNDAAVSAARIAIINKKWSWGRSKTAIRLMS